MTESTEIQKAGQPNLAEMAALVVKTGMCPNSYKNKPDDALVAMQIGQTIGLTPHQSLLSIAVINGRPALWGDALQALLLRQPQFVNIEETIEKGVETGADGATAENVKAVCKIQRKIGENVVDFVSEFSWKDAQNAGLTRKSGPWQHYPKRMLQLRARGFCIRDAFPDALMGLTTEYDADAIIDDHQKSLRADDAIQDMEPLIVGHQADTLRDLLEMLEPETEERMLAYFNAPALQNIKAADFDRAFQILKAKAEAKARQAAPADPDPAPAPEAADQADDLPVDVPAADDLVEAVPS